MYSFVHNNNFIKQRELERTFFSQGMTQDIIPLLDKIEQLQLEAFQAGYHKAEAFLPPQWSNQAALGYVIMAAERMDMKNQDIQRITKSMNTHFDMKTLGEAADYYRKSPF